MANQEERTLDIARYIIENNATIRQTAKHFGISKSTVHRDINERLKILNENIYNEVVQILEIKRMEKIIVGYSPQEDLKTSPPVIRKPRK
jgi:putative DeoR family transcriptional regulator (stage III sporulation protein D)